jgi:hypothetical protein
MNGNTKKCAQCGKEMEALKSTKRYCTNACKQAAFYVRNAQVLTDDKDNRWGVSDLRQRSLTSWRFYYYTATIHGPCIDCYPYYEEPLNSINQPEPNDGTEPLVPLTTCSDSKEQFQTILSSGIYGSVIQSIICYQEEYKQVVPINDYGSRMQVERKT